MNKIRRAKRKANKALRPQKERLFPSSSPTNPLLPITTGMIKFDWNDHDVPTRLYIPSPPRIDTVGSFSDDLKMPVTHLIDQFRAAGVGRLTPDTLLTEVMKGKLLKYLRRIHGSTSEQGREDTEQAESIQEVYESPVILPDQIIKLESVDDELMYLLSKNPELIYQLEARKFEEMVARILDNNGYKDVQLTPQTRDGGYDIFARIQAGLSSFIVFVECKRYAPANPVGVQILRGLHSVIASGGANQGMIVTSSYFSSAAKKERDEKKLTNLIDFKDYASLTEWLSAYTR